MLSVVIPPTTPPRVKGPPRVKRPEERIEHPLSKVISPAKNTNATHCVLDTPWALSFQHADEPTDVLTSRFVPDCLRAPELPLDLRLRETLLTSTWTQRADCPLSLFEVMDDRELSCCSSQTVLPYVKARQAFMTWWFTTPADAREVLVSVSAAVERYYSWFTRDWCHSVQPANPNAKPHHRQDEALLIHQSKVSRWGGVGTAVCAVWEDGVELGATRRPAFIVEQGDMVISARYLVAAHGEQVCTRAAAVKFMLHYLEVWTTLIRCPEVARVFAELAVATAAFGNAAQLLATPRACSAQFNPRSRFVKAMTVAVDTWASAMESRGQFNWDDVEPYLPSVSGADAMLECLSSAAPAAALPSIPEGDEEVFIDIMTQDPPKRRAEKRPRSGSESSERPERSETKRVRRASREPLPIARTMRLRSRKE